MLISAAVCLCCTNACCALLLLCFRQPENFLLAGEVYDEAKVRREREEAIRKRKEVEQRESGRSAPTTGATKKLTKGQKKKLKAKAKKLAEKSKQQGVTPEEEHAHDEDEDEVEVEDDEAAMEEPHTVNTLAFLTSASSSSTSLFALPSTSPASSSLPTSSSTASTVTSNSFSTDSFASASSDSFTSSSSFNSPAPYIPPKQIQSGKAELPSFPAPPPPVPSASHLDSMLAAFDSLSINSPASLLPSLSSSSSPLSSSSPFSPHLPFLTKLCDLGNGCWVDKHFTDDVTTRQYRAPEVLVGYPYTTAIDIWSTACLVFELVTGDYLFDPKEATGPSNKTGGANSAQYDRDEDHLALMMELLGTMPRKITTYGKYSEDFFTKRGELKHIKELDKWGLRDVLVDKYKLSRAEADGLSSFLLPMLTLDPERRVTAEQALRSPWLWENNERGAESGDKTKGGKGYEDGKDETVKEQADEAAVEDDDRQLSDDEEDAEDMEAEMEGEDVENSDADVSDNDDGDYEYHDEEEEDESSGEEDDYSGSKRRQPEKEPHDQR